MTAKLSDIQFVLLTAACQREDGGLLPPPESLGDQTGRIRKAVEALIKNDLAAEKEGMTAAQAWRSDGDLTIGSGASLIANWHLSQRRKCSRVGL